jgi:hypothetical protein
MRTGQALGLGAWLLVIAWLVLYVTGSEEAAGWCMLGAALLVFAAGPLFWRHGDAQQRLAGLTMVGAGVFFVAIGLILLL